MQSIPHNACMKHSIFFLAGSIKKIWANDGIMKYIVKNALEKWNSLHFSLQDHGFSKLWLRIGSKVILILKLLFFPYKFFFLMGEATQCEWILWDLTYLRGGLDDRHPSPDFICVYTYTHTYFVLFLWGIFTFFFNKEKSKLEQIYKQYTPLKLWLGKNFCSKLAFLCSHTSLLQALHSSIQGISESQMT